METTVVHSVVAGTSGSPETRGTMAPPGST